MLFVLILFVVCSIIILYQDFKYREISVPVIVCYGVLNIIISLEKSSLKVVMTQFIYNVIILAILMATVVVYFSIKYKKIQIIIDKQLGLGDVILLLILAFSFSYLQFIKFIIIVNIAVIITYGLLKLWKNSAGKLIPYAGILSFSYLLYQIHCYL